jgi:hypothetical protein
LPQSRRHFVAAFSASLVALLLPRKALASEPHPVPRPNVTGAKVLTSKQLTDTPDLVPLFDSIRAIPYTVDGIRCNCGCPNPPEYYSLLSCFEGDAMAQTCVVCQNQGRLVVRLHKEGKSLEQIRAAVDAKFA